MVALGSAAFEVQAFGDVHALLPGVQRLRIMAVPA